MMWWSFVLPGNQIDEGRHSEVGNVEPWRYLYKKDDGCLQKDYTSPLNTSPHLNPPDSRIRRGGFSGKRGKLQCGIVDSVFGGLLWLGRFGWRSGLNVPQIEMFTCSYFFCSRAIWHHDFLTASRDFSSSNIVAGCPYPP